MELIQVLNRKKKEQDPVMNVIPKTIRDNKLFSKEDLKFMATVTAIPSKNVDVQIKALYVFQQMGVSSLEEFLKYLIRTKNIEWAWQLILILEASIKQ